MPDIEDTPLYVSQYYNPHSLAREWGFVLAELRPALTLQKGDLRPGRLAIAREIQALLPATNNGPKPAIILPSHAGSVSTDLIDNDLALVRQQVGSDILCLTLLSDVPLDRPLHINQNSLIGHWRWLRQVWSQLASDKSSPAILTPELSAFANSAVADKIVTGHFNTAIAALRQQFNTLRGSEDTLQTPGARLSFIQNLTLFCPFIGTELLYRFGHAPLGANRHAKDCEE